MTVDRSSLYRPSDPEFSIVCHGCRFRRDHRCAEQFTIHAGVYAGTYRCTCTSCRAAR